MQPPITTFECISEFPNPAAPKALTLKSIAGSLLKTSNMLAPVLFGIYDVAKGTKLTHAQFHKEQDGGKHAVIFVNGFLTKGDRDVTDWKSALGRKFGRATWYHFDWDSVKLDLNLLPTIYSVPSTIDAMFRDREPGVLTAWHSAMLSAERAGRLLAQAIMCTPGWRFTLAGHSLGARVIHFALKELAQHSVKRVENVYLLGGAVGGAAKDDGNWEKAVGAVKGNIYNFYSQHDSILKLAYRGANIGLSSPIGLTGIHYKHERIKSRKACHKVGGHLAWKANFSALLEEIRQEERQAVAERGF